MKIQKQRKYNTFFSVKNKDILSSVKDRVSLKDKGSTVLIPHVCSQKKFTWSKFSQTLNQEFPIAKENFAMLSKAAILGKTQFIEVFQDKTHKHSIIIANMIANKDANHPFASRKINYAALCYCMNAIKFKAKELSSLDENKKVEIHSPKFGTSSSGGNWSFISELIEDIWCNIDTYIYNQYV